MNIVNCCTVRYFKSKIVNRGESFTSANQSRAQIGSKFSKKFIKIKLPKMEFGQISSNFVVAVLPCL